MPDNKYLITHIDGKAVKLGDKIATRKVFIDPSPAGFPSNPPPSLTAPLVATTFTASGFPHTPSYFNIWDGTSWTKVAGPNTAGVYDSTVSGSGEAVLAGRTIASNEQQAYIYNTQTQSLTATQQIPILAAFLCADTSPAGTVFIAGGLGGQGGNGGPFKLTGTTLSPVGTGYLIANSNAYINALYAEADNSIYVAGDFVSISGVSVSNVAHWDGTSWSAFSSAPAGNITSFTKDIYGNLYAAGTFPNIGQDSVPQIARWTGSNWTALGAAPNGTTCYSITADKFGNIYVAGNFTSIGGISANRIAKYNATTSEWSALGAGIAGATKIQIQCDSTGALYALGAFSSAGNVAGTANAARWDGTTWSPLGTGLPAAPYFGGFGLTTGQTPQ